VVGFFDLAFDLSAEKRVKPLMKNAFISISEANAFLFLVKAG
jgi:hypothetical protein